MRRACMNETELLGQVVNKALKLFVPSKQDPKDQRPPPQSSQNV